MPGDFVFVCKHLKRLPCEARLFFFLSSFYNEIQAHSYNLAFNNTGIAMLYFISAYLGQTNEQSMELYLCLLLCLRGLLML